GRQRAGGLSPRADGPRPPAGRSRARAAPAAVRLGVRSRGSLVSSFAFQSPLPAYRYVMPAAVIIGAGVFGSALAHRLALDAWDVTLVEQQSPGWDGSASSGESRLLRFSHGHEA